MTINFVYCVVVLVQIISISTIVCQSQDDEDIPSNNCTHCQSGCNNITRDCAGDCDPGFYGTSCNLACPSNCLKGCTKDKGECTYCKSSYYGVNCTDTCPTTCHNQYCDQTGHCIGCNDTFYGNKCEKHCPSNCKTACKQSNGECIYGCKGGFWSNHCENNCSISCQSTCEQNSGSCWKCKVGYGGINCVTKCMLPHCDSCQHNDTCAVCSDGWYGETCAMNCSLHCKDSKCSKLDGSCTCLNGWFGEKCDQKCIDNCDFCIDNTTCNMCHGGFYGRYCEHRCPENCTSCSRNGATCNDCSTNKLFGELCTCDIDQCLERESESNCTKCIQAGGWYLNMGGCCKCSGHCKGGYENCENTTGICLNGCEPGYYGEKCVDKCSSHCAGNGTVCNSTTGECPSGCQNDWYLSTCKYGCSFFTPHCNKCSQHTLSNGHQTASCQECGDGFYKPVTETFCKKCVNCLNDKCDGRSGRCRDGCKQGWWMGPYNSGICNFECDPHCVGNECDHMNGTCLQGCENGWSGDRCWKTCSKSCVNATCDRLSQKCVECMPGYWGNDCSNDCRHCLGGECNQSTGICKAGCQNGYYGQMCNTSCNSCLGDSCDSNGRCLSGCIQGNYGRYCNETCPGHCLVCHPVTGICLNMSPICNGSKCNYNFTNSVCSPGKYGFQCQDNCSSGCSNISSNGYICEKYSGACIETCPSSLYGFQCEKKCGQCASTKNVLASCDPSNGHCSSHCLKGYYGDKCLAACNTTCLDSTCGNDGTCLKGCTDGWAGLFCEVNMKSPKKKKETGLPGGEIAGIVIGIVAFIAIISSLIGYFVYRRRNSDGSLRYRLRAMSTNSY